MPPHQPPAGFTCSICGKQYQHSSHLRRHEATHLGSEEFKCPHCDKLFGRRDVWRKHYTSCPKNTAQDGPPPAKRGKKPRACDACFRSKLSCDGSLSCARCKSRQVTCTYSRLQARSDDAGMSSPSTLSASASTSSVGTSSTAATLADDDNTKDENTKIPVSFLLSLTNPDADSMVSAFRDEPGRDDDAPSVDLHPETTHLTPSPSPDTDPTPTDGLFFSWVFGQMYSDDAHPSPEFNFNLPNLPPLPLNAIPSPSTIDPALEPILTSLSTLHSTLVSTDSTYDGTFDASLAAQVFTLSNRAAFIPAYFRHTHRDLPLLHRPSFSVQTSSPALVLVVFLCGALYSPPRDCVLAIPRFFRIAEEYVFRRLEDEVRLLKGGLGGDNLEGEEGEGMVNVHELRVYETLQAAILIHGAQLMNNDAAGRRRNWTVRKPPLVEAVRGLGLTRARQMQRVDWRRWVRDETRIRIATWTALADWQQCGMWHMPGMMTVHEMTGDMPSLPELWEANDAAEFEAVMASKGKDCWRRTASLAECMEALMAGSWSGIEGFPLKGLSMLDLFIFISTLHPMIGAARLMCLLRTNISAFQRATDRWQELWQTITAQLNDKQLLMSGFVRHSGEFCWMAKALLQQAQTGKDKKSAYFQKIGHGSLKPLHELLRNLKVEW
ncbi:hypothetical protein VTI74DRAFT_4378 [Chaetomium olivicolor]